MIAQEQTLLMQDAATRIRRAFRCVGCYEPIQLIDHDMAIRIGTYSDHLTVRYDGDMWQVFEYTPYLQCMRSYGSLAECIHDIALCEVGVVFEQIDHLEQEIDDAIAAAPFN